MKSSKWVLLKTKETLSPLLPFVYILRIKKMRNKVNDRMHAKSFMQLFYALPRRDKIKFAFSALFGLAFIVGSILGSVYLLDPVLAANPITTYDAGTNGFLRGVLYMVSAAVSGMYGLEFGHLLGKNLQRAGNWITSKLVPKDQLDDNDPRKFYPQNYKKYLANPEPREVTQSPYVTEEASFKSESQKALKALCQAKAREKNKPENCGSLSQEQYNKIDSINFAVNFLRCGSIIGLKHVAKPNNYQDQFINTIIGPQA